MADLNDFHQAGSSCFLNRLLELPSVHDAVALASSFYRRTKEYRCVGAVVGATESNLRMAVMGVMPLATPILHRVGGWQALDGWACRGLDSVELMAPIVKLPTSEVLEDVRERVLGLVAGGPASAGERLTMTNALAARVHSTVELASDTKCGRMAIGVTGRLLDVAQSIVDHYLPQEEGHLQDSDGRSGGVVTKASTLACSTRRRLYSVCHSVVHPNHPDCDSFTPSQLVCCATAGVREWYWTPRQMAGEDQQKITVSQVLVCMAMDAYISMVSILGVLLRILASFDPRAAAASVVVRRVFHLGRVLADKIRVLIEACFHFAMFCLALEHEVPGFWVRFLGSVHYTGKSVACLMHSFLFAFEKLTIRLPIHILDNFDT